MDTILNQWVQRSRTGDREAFAQIVRQYQQIVSGITFGILGDFHKSEDIAQETFLIAWKKLDQLEDAAKLPAWLCQIARNLAKQHLLKTTGKTTVPICETDFPVNAEEPIEQAIREERSRLIWDAVARIPEKYRIPLILYYRSEKSSSAIAAALEISEDALSMRLSRAKKYLRKELEKQLEGAISSSGPGEFFSLAVIASLPAVLSAASTGEAVAATTGAATTGTTATFAASAMVAAEKSGPSGTSLFGASFFGIFGSMLLGIISTSFACLFFILGAVPGIWFSARNAPTLRTRRYLILSSLRAHLIIAFACFIVWALFPSIRLGFELAKNYGLSLTDKTWWSIDHLVPFGLLFIFGAIVVVFAVVSPWCYRRVLREDLGLSVLKKPVPLEESLLSFARLEKTYKRFSTACLVMLIWYFANFLIGNVFLATGITKGRFEWSVGYFLEFQGVLIGFMFVGIIFYLVFRKFHRRLLETAKDEATFENVGPIWDRSQTPFGKKVFVEWLVYFGCFIAAGVIIALRPSFDYHWVPEYPIPLSLKLGLILAASIAFAAINAAFPRLRWLVIPGACYLTIWGIGTIYRSLDYGQNTSFLDSPGDWPYLFGIIFLNIFVAISIFATLILGGLHYFAQWNGKPVRFSLPKKIAIALCISGTLLLFVAPWCYSSLQAPYWGNRVIFKKGTDAEKLEICDEMIRLSDKKGYYYFCALDSRSKIYTNRGEYEKAIADFDILIQLYHEGKLGKWERQRLFSRFFYGRGNVRFATGDLEGAIADYSESLNLGPASGVQKIDALYNRGFAYEKLGETKKAIADYTRAIRRMEDKQRVSEARTLVSRSEEHLPKGITLVSLDELKEIRDRLQNK